MAQPTLSVLVPVYNVQEYLALSIDSVRNQTYSDIEIICVNDGSTDDSHELLAMYEALDDRIKVVEKPNGGLSSARNAGIAAATGKYLCFLDSDDLLVPEACATIVAAFEKTHADVLTYGGVAYPDFWSYHWLDVVLSPREAFYEGFDPAILFEEQSRPFVWRTACDRQFLLDSGVLFDETIIFGEDQIFHFEIYPRARKVAFIPDKLVQYRVARTGSLMFSRSADPLGRIHDHVTIVDHILNDWRQAGFLENYHDEMFGWTVDFVMLDIINLPPDQQTEALGLLREVWERYFPLDYIEKQGHSDRFGLMVRLVMKGETIGTSDAYKARFFYYMRTYGKRDAVGRTWRLVKRKMLDPVKGKIHHRTGAEEPPEENAYTRPLSRDERWELNDAIARAKATQELYTSHRRLD